MRLQKGRLSFSTQIILLRRGGLVTLRSRDGPRIREWLLVASSSMESEDFYEEHNRDHDCQFVFTWRRLPNRFEKFYRMESLRGHLERSVMIRVLDFYLMICGNARRHL